MRLTDTAMNNAKNESYTTYRIYKTQIRIGKNSFKFKINMYNDLYLLEIFSNQKDEHLTEITAYILDDLLFSTVRNDHNDSLNLKLLNFQQETFMYVMYMNNKINLNEILKWLVTYNDDDIQENLDSFKLNNLIERYPEMDMYKKLKFLIAMEASS